MKKQVLLIAAIAAGVFTTTDANAQDFKPVAGHNNIEVNFAPLGNAPISINSLKYRRFITSDMAFRLGFAVSSTSDKTPAPVFNADVNDKSSVFGLTINPGIEKHFAGTDRLSPYVGAALNFNMVSEKDITNNDVTGSSTETYETTVKDGSLTFGLNLLIGTDWYFTKHMYMGTEVGFGFSLKNNKDTETSTPGSDTVKRENGSEFKLGPNFNSAIRLGFLF